jgi:hypothetical protein
MSMKFSSVKLSALAVAAVLSGCAVQERVYVPAPSPYVPPPPPVATVEVGAVEVTASEAPPPLPDYEQPPCPEDGFLWTPGYWAWGAGGYYWVPGTWVQPPRVGFLWTPGYWGFAGGVYGFHAGYWGPQVGFYGGVNYGFGYVGVGFAGGRWDGGHFAYNTAVNNVNVTVVHNTYNQTVINNNVTVNRVSFNGGAGGVQAQPTAQERSYAREPHVPPTALQVQHRQEASSNPALAARANGGHPAIAATARPAQFSGPGVVGAHGAANLHTETPNANTPRSGGFMPPTANGAAHAPTANTVAHAPAAQSDAARPQFAQQPKPAIAKSPAPRPAAPRPSAPPKPQQQAKKPQSEKPRE